MSTRLSYAANCSLLFTEHPLLDRPAAARAAGFEAIEFWWPWPDRPVPEPSDVDRFVDAVERSGVRLIALNFYGGDVAGPDCGVLSIPARHQEFRDNVAVAVAIGARLGVRGFNALYGNRVLGVDPAVQDDLAVENLRFAAAAAATIGAKVYLEPISGPKPYPLRTAADVVAVLDRVGVDNVGLLADLFHLANNGADLDAELTAYADRIAHVQVADWPGRGEPGSGTLDLAGCLGLIADLGYTGEVALEYVPTTTTEASLARLGAAEKTRSEPRSRDNARVTTPDLILAGTVLTPDGLARRRVEVTDGRISAIELLGDAPADAGPPAEVMVLLADDEVLIPGLVDTHVHINEPGRTEWEGFVSATRAAAAGGVTTVLDMPLNSIPATTSIAALEIKRASAEGQVAVDIGFWAGAVPDSLGRLAELHAAGVFGFKCFLLDSGVPEFPPLSPDQLRLAMTEIAAFDGLLIVHAEDPQVIGDHAVAHTTAYAEFLGSRPPDAENTAIATVIEAARATGCRVHIVHLSSAEAVPAIRAARADGVRLTIETCPHYLTLVAEDIADGQTQYKCCPPVRDAANSELLWQALAEGVIDIIVSDHSPSTVDLKRLDEGDFGAAWGGISSLQLGLSLIWTHARRRGHDLAQVVNWMAGRPAALMGVADKGAIAVGNAADLVVFAPDASWTVDVEDLHHRNPITPYDGRSLDGVVRTSYLAGEPVSFDDAPHGKLIRHRK